jgi:threonine aldolase
MIDLRSDTLTLPSVEMKEKMLSVKLGDDVFGEDPTVNLLEQNTASMFGMESAIFCPSGTMTNQIAINIHTQPGDEVICSRESHIYNYEGGGIAKNSGASVRLIERNNGLLKHEDVLNNINQDDVHCPRTALVALENTSNRGGGVCYSIDELLKIKKVCVQSEIPLHLDGARIFNAIVEKKQSPKSYGQIFDSISICLSKGLGAPVGSLLIGNEQFINRARRVRKVFGGGMRQAGIIAAGGIYALENNIDRLVDDHKRAKTIANAAKKCSWIENVIPVETNIIVCYMKQDKSNIAFIDKLEKDGIKCIPFGEGRVRMVTHLDVSDVDVNQVCEKLNF